VAGVEAAHRLLGVCIAEDPVWQPVVQCFGLEDGAEGLLHSDESSGFHDTEATLARDVVVAAHLTYVNHDGLAPGSQGLWDDVYDRLRPWGSI
jgi:hypothetical protein